MADFLGMVDKRNILLLLGCYCNNPRLVLVPSSETVSDDYPEFFHKMIWGAIYNIAKIGNVMEITPLDIENELSVSLKKTQTWELERGYEYIEECKRIAKDKEGNVKHYRDTVRKYSIIRDAIQNLQLNVDNVYNEQDEEIMDRFNNLSVEELMNQINIKFINFKSKWNSSKTAKSYTVGENISKVLDEYKNNENVYGFPFQSEYMNTITRGMRQGKFFLRSAPSGHGKTRNSFAEAVNISCDRLYDWNKKQWISLGEKEPVLFISTEINLKDLQRMAIAHISGVAQHKFNNWYNLTTEEQDIIYESIEIIENATLSIEYMSDFTIDSIKDTIEKHIATNKTTKVFFDYINDSPSLYADFYERTKTRLQTHQILFMFSQALKNITDDYDVFLSSSTQVSNDYKQEGNQDSSALKGSKAIAEKIDIGVLALPVTKKMLLELEPIIKSDGSFGQNIPNMSYHIYKNRDGQYNNVIVFTKLDLGTMREVDCFVTDNNYELIAMDKTQLMYEGITLDEVEEIEVPDEYGKNDIVGMIDSIKSIS